MYELVTLSPTCSSFNISTMSSFSLPRPVEDTENVEARPSQATKDGEALPSVRASHISEEFACPECMDIFMRAVEVVKRFPGRSVEVIKHFPLKLEQEMLVHFYNYDSSVSMNADFRKLAGWVADAVRRRYLSSHLSMMQLEYLHYTNGLSRPSHQANTDAKEDADMDGMFDFDGYAADGKADNCGQDDTHAEASSEVMGPDDSASQTGHRHTRAAELAEKPLKESKSVEKGLDGASSSAFSEVANVSALEPDEATKDHVDAESKGSSKFSEVSDISALNPALNPANESGSSRAMLKATRQTEDQDRIDQARALPFGYIQSEEKGFDSNFFIRQATRKQRTMRWLDKIE
jgi:hypothetical protein